MADRLEIFITNIANQHQNAHEGVEGVHQPDWTQRQAANVQPVDDVAEIIE
jgi:hypothetical protein